MAESHYKSNLRDLEFNLFEMNRIQDGVLGHGAFTTMDHETAQTTLRELEKFAQEKLAPSYIPSDRTPLVLDDKGNVTLPPELHDSLKAWFEAGWHYLEIKEEYGGYGACPSVIWAAFETVVGANANCAFYQYGAAMSHILDRIATEDQKKRYVRNIVDRHWGATMVLTEPEAGSDVGAGRTKATDNGDGTWNITGTKRFITNGDYDQPENIVHMVLARPEGAPPGTKGLSLFIVPKFWVNEDGSLGERNGVYVTGIEHKMGLKASATCELTLGDGQPCRGLLVGDKHDGIRQMFQVIENARMSIGVKSMSTLSTAYLNALEYAKERVQGADLLNIMDKTAPRVSIIQHPDVRRMLMDLKATSEGLRALVFFAASTQDRLAVMRAEGADEAEIKATDRLNDLLLPMVKGYASEKVYEQLAQALQVFGGSGYCMDYPIEQYIRDQKIDSLYEGTTHIQALDFAFRKVARDQGATLQGLVGQMQKTVDDELGGEALADARKALARGITDVGGMLMAMMGKMGDSLYHVGLHGNRMLFSVSELTIGWLLIRHAAVALEKREGAHEADRAFYDGKIASANWWAKTVLPALTLNRKLIENGDLALMEMDNALF